VTLCHWRGRGWWMGHVTRKGCL